MHRAVVVVGIWREKFFHCQAHLKWPPKLREEDSIDNLDIVSVLFMTCLVLTIRVYTIYFKFLFLIVIWLYNGKLNRIRDQITQMWKLN